MLFENKISAAHCIVEKYFKHSLSPADLVVLLGAHNLTSTFEKGVKRHDVNEIHVHPDWNAFSQSYDADIAILVLSEFVTFTNYIRPVCMPTDDDIIDGATGSIVGWGLTENRTRAHLEYPKQTLTNALNASYCLTTDSYVAIFSSKRSFCGGEGDGSPKKGDSGGGFFVLSAFGWMQYGIISAQRINAVGRVDVNSFSIYTNVKLFTNWIDKTVSKAGLVVKTVSEAAKKIVTLDCNYVLDNSR